MKENAKDALALGRLKKVSALSGEEISAIALQTRHDGLCADDQSWVKPEALTPMESIVAQILKERLPPDSRPLRERARHVVQVIDNRLVETALTTRSLGILDADLVLHPVTTNAGAARITKATGACIPLPGELTRRLQENGLELPKGSPDRRQLGLAVLRAKNAAVQDVEARSKGNQIETPKRPARIAPLEQSAAAGQKTLSQMHETWVGLETPDRKTVDDNKLYVDRFINLHGDIDVRHITRAHVRDFRDMLCQLPRNAPKHLSGTAMKELVAFAAANPKRPLLSRSTVNAKGIDAISKLINKAISNDYAESNPCTLLRLTIKMATRPGDFPSTRMI